MYHQQISGVGRRHLDVPTTVDFRRLLQEIDSRSQAWDVIRVSLGQDMLYDIELSGCRTYLLSVRRGSEPVNLQSFLNKKLRKDGSNWRDYIQFADDSWPGLEQLIRCTEMLSRQTFTLICWTNGASQTLDPDDQFNEGIFHVAAVFSRIVNRGLELDEYKELQRTLSGEAKTNPGITPVLTLRLGRLLLSLRWRVSWWTLENGLPEGHHDVEERQVAIRLVGYICKILYFYFFYVKNKRLSRSTGFEVPEGWRSWYVDMHPGRTVYESFPIDETMPGFVRWMQEGQAKIVEAGLWVQPGFVC